MTTRISFFGVLILSALSTVHAGGFLGFSVTKVDGTVGYWGVNLVCQTEYGADARMCDSREIIKGGKLVPDGDVLHARVQPYYVPTTTSGPYAPTQTAFDMSGLADDPKNLTCEGYVSATGTGLAVRGDNFGFAKIPCSEQYEVACCTATRCFAFPD